VNGWYPDWTWCYVPGYWLEYAWDNSEDVRYSAKGWYIIGITYYKGKTIYYVWKDSDYSTPYGVKTLDQAYSDFRVIIGNHIESLAMSPGTTVEAWFDWVRIRKYVSPEPIVTLSEEESA